MLVIALDSSLPLNKRNDEGFTNAFQERAFVQNVQLHLPVP
jgi:hypothetical protein